jgi:hypothetical protein
MAVIRNEENTARRGLVGHTMILAKLVEPGLELMKTVEERGRKKSR